MRMKKFLSLFLALVMVLSLVPATAFATSTNNVYISVSYDGQYINDKNGGYIAYVAVPMETVAAINLDDYGLSDYWYDEDGDGNYETTALQLIIYAHENIYGGDFSEVDFTGGPGSSYFQGGIFGFDENLNYYLNGQYPLAGEGWGATSDQIVLEVGDFIDMASFSSWDFYQDSGYGFHFFADENGDIVHNYTGEVGTALDVKLIKGTKDENYNSVFTDVPNYCIHYGEVLYNEDGQVYTDADAGASITFPSAGTYYLWADGGYGVEFPDSIVSAPGYAKVTVTAAETSEQPREAQSVTTQLNATMAQLAATVTAPAFGTDAGEWTVLSLARGGYYAKDNKYFTDYYTRIVDTVNTTAASVNMSGALHKNKSTENSRLIVALSALGIDATSVGNWDLVEAYSANGFDWIKKQGLNGPIWALIALDSNNYATDTALRETCITSILESQHNDGGWALQANKDYASDPDVTGMALTALYPYRNDEDVAAACEKAFDCLSAMQHENGTFASGGSECAESCAWVIVAATTWGINPDTDSRFIKNGKSVVDGLLSHYLSDSATFQHIVGAGANGMATDQSCYALVAYDRFINGEKALFDYSDVTFEERETPAAGAPKVTLGLPEEITNDVGTIFNANVSINNKWGEGYKLLDMVMTVPAGLKVNAVETSRLSGGEMRWNLHNGKLRMAYLDAANKSDITITNNASGNNSPAEMFTIEFEVETLLEVEKPLAISIDGMSLKCTSDSTATDDSAMTELDTETAEGEVVVVEGISYSAKRLYVGDDVDLIPSTKMAVAVAVTGLDEYTTAPTLTYNTEGSNSITFLHSAEMSAKTGINTYVALVDASISVENFTNEKNFTLNKATSAAITFGDSNADGSLNAQDALAAVDTWLRKGDAPTDNGILTLNVNGDSRLNTFDALGIVEMFVDQAEAAVVTLALSLKPAQASQQ